jgi:opacity protein-like surface antigen
MKKLVVTTLALSASLAAMNSIAGQMGPTSREGGFYAEVDGGYAQLDTNTNLIPATKVDKGDFAFGLRGGYEAALSDGWLWGLEAGYFNLGKTQYKNVLGLLGANADIKQQGGDILAVLKKELGNGLNIFGKAGGAYVKQEGDVTVPGATIVVANSNKFLPEIAGGLGYQVTDSVAVTGTVNHIFGDKLNANTSTSTVASSTAAMVGLRLNLG